LKQLQLETIVVFLNFASNLHPKKTEQHQ